MIARILLTIVVGSVGGFFLYKLKVPGGFMVGAMLGVAIVNVASGQAFMPKATKIVVQIVAGAFVGCTVTREDIRRLPFIFKPTVILISSLLFINILGGALITHFSPLDPLTSLLSMVPGGLSDVPILAADMGADGAIVTVLQLVRNVVGVGVFPSVIAFCCRSDYGNKKTAPKTTDRINAGSNKNRKYSAGTILLTAIVAVCGGLIGRWSGLPGCTLVFALVAVVIYSLATDKAFIPANIKRCAQVVSGCYLGSTITMQTLQMMRGLVLPVVIVIALYLSNCFVVGRIIHRTSRFTRKEGMLIATPAGTSDMALISADIGVQNSDVILIQAIRSVLAVSAIPQIMFVLSGSSLFSEM